MNLDGVLGSGLASFTSATSNSFGGGGVGRASTTPGGFSPGVLLTLSTTTTGVGVGLCSSFSPSCLSRASKTVSRPAPASGPNGRNGDDHFASKFQLPFSPVSSDTAFVPTCTPNIPLSPAAKERMVILRQT